MAKKATKGITDAKRREVLKSFRDLKSGEPIKYETIEQKQTALGRPLTQLEIEQFKIEQERYIPGKQKTIDQTLMEHMSKKKE